VTSSVAADAEAVIVVEPPSVPREGAGEGSGWPPEPLVVRPGEMVVLTGPAGSGKSHLLRLAAGLAHDDHRRVTIAGHDLGSLSARGRRQALAAMRLLYLSQEAPLVSNLTVLENLLLPTRYLGEGSEREAIGRALALMDAAGIGWAAGYLPARLSEEDRRAAALLRGFLRRPVAAILDDPLSGLRESGLTAVLPLVRAALMENGCAILAAATEMIAFTGLPAREAPLPSSLVGSPRREGRA
jgi:putative ABC transport system ATP-binding protein